MLIFLIIHHIRGLLHNIRSLYVGSDWNILTWIDIKLVWNPALVLTFSSHSFSFLFFSFLYQWGCLCCVSPPDDRQVLHQRDKTVQSTVNFKGFEDQSASVCVFLCVSKRGYRRHHCDLKAKMMRRLWAETVRNKQVQVTSSDRSCHRDLWITKVTVWLFTSRARNEYQVVFGDSGDPILFVVMASFKGLVKEQRDSGGEVVGGGFIALPTSSKDVQPSWEVWK